MIRRMVVVGFWLSFTATLAAAAAALWSGWRRRRRLHLVLGPVTVVLLAITIVFAEKLGRARVFPPDEMAIHLLFAKVGALLALPVIVTGLLLLRRPAWRRWHRIAVLLWLLFVLIATGTGIWVFSLSEPGS